MRIEPVIEVQEADFDLGASWSALQGRVGQETGAITGFTGLVRAATASDAGGSLVNAPVKALVLEHYPGMTQSSMRDIVAQADARWDLLGVHVIHRVGRLLPGEQIVMVLVASGHRASAFAACEFIMDYLKTDAVLWKREDYLADAGEEDAQADPRSRWLHSAEEDKQRRTDWKP